MLCAEQHLVPHIPDIKLGAGDGLHEHPVPLHSLGTVELPHLLEKGSRIEGQLRISVRN